jgi:hypothetical protein
MKIISTYEGSYEHIFNAYIYIYTHIHSYIPRAHTHTHASTQTRFSITHDVMCRVVYMMTQEMMVKMNVFEDLNEIHITWVRMKPV